MNPSKPPAAKWLTLGAVSLGLGMLMIDTFVVNVALPSIARDLDASLAAAEWTVSGYVLVLAVLPLAMGRLGDIFGRKLVYLLGLGVFVAASAACGLARSIEELAALRVLQGAGAAVMMPLTLSILTNAFPPAQRGLAIGLWGGISGLGLIGGPILGGVIVEGLDWRWIFLVNVPIGAAGLVMGARFIRESRDTGAPRTIDWPGLVLLTGGLTAIMLALTEANQLGWDDRRIVAGLAGGPALLGLFCIVELRRSDPLVDIRLFRNRTFTVACLSAFLFSAAVFGSQPFTSLFMQNYLGLSALQGGLAFVPATALVALLTPFSGVIGQRMGHHLRLLLAGGAVAVAFSFVYLLWITPESHYVDGLLPAFLLRGLGIGLVMSASSLAVMSAIPLSRSGLASGTLTMCRQAGTAVGVALMGAVFLHHVRTDLPGRLDGASAEEAGAIQTAAQHFIASGQGATLTASQDAIVEGFILLAVAGLLISAAAAVAAAFVRHRMLDETPVAAVARAAPIEPLPERAAQ
jgi:DHA2 family methylenomycin A resistance protein-like MFS transporter